MRATVYFGPGDLRTEDMPRPEPGPGELLIAVAAAGICGTDATEYVAGPVLFPLHHAHPVSGHVGPMIPGHEFSGRIVGVGSDVSGNFHSGDLISSGAGIACGACDRCAEGRTNLCRRYSTVGLNQHGALAEFVTIAASACTNITDRSISADLGAIAQPLAVAVHAMRRGGEIRDREVLIVGAGGIGAFLVRAAVVAGAHVVVVDRNAERTALASSLGAQEIHVLDPTVENPLAGRQFPVVYECSGSAPGLQSAIAHTERGGRIVLVGIQKGETTLDLRQVVLAEQQLIGTVAHVFGVDFAHSLELLEADPELWQPLAPIVQPLSDVENGIKSLAAGNPAAIKLLYDPQLEAQRLVAVR